MSDLKFSKIADEDMNLDVQGQACWDRCVHEGHWVNAVDGLKPIYGCYHQDDYRDTEGAVLYIF